MGTPTIPNGEEYFFNILYEGNSAGQKVGKFVPFTDNGTIANSCIFDSASEPYLERTPSSASNRKTWTLSFWMKLGTSSADKFILSVNQATSDSGRIAIKINSTKELQISGYNAIWRKTNRTFEDTSKFYHILIACDTTESTAQNRIRFYIDGDEVTSWNTNQTVTQDADLAINVNSAHRFAEEIWGGGNHFDGYLAEVNFVDGSQLTPSTFGLTDTNSGRWIPKTLSGITYGTNGFRFTFADSSAFGDDTSGNTNDFTATNLASTDQTTDSPTQNFATGTATASSGNLIPHTISEGNLTFNNPNGTSGRGFSTARSTLRLDPKSDTGYYCEVKVDTTAGGNGLGVGVTDVRADAVQQNSSNGYFGVGNNFQLFQDSFYFREINGSGINVTDASTFPAFTTGDTLGLAFKSGKLWIAKNNTWYNSGNPSTGANPLVELSNNTLYRFCLSLFGMNLSGAPKGTFNFGQKSLTYTAPTGFVSLNQDNMPTTDRGVSGLTWTKDRDATASWMCIDSSRIYTAEGVPGAMNLDNTNKEYGQIDFVDGINKFLKGGFTVATSNNTHSYINKSGNANVGYSWVANSGTTATNTNGSITSSVQANTTAGFSIVTYTGTGSNATVGHGLSSAPEWMIIKQRNADGEGWSTYHKSFTSAAYIATINNTNAPASSATDFNSTAPTSTVFSVGTNARTNASSATYVAYCWHGVLGFSQFGKFVGNGNADGPFIYTGFKPAWIVFKANRITNWYHNDGARSPFNPVTIGIDLNTSAVEYDGGVYVGGGVDYLSNGFKIRQTTGLGYNYTGEEIYYMCFAEHPFVGDGTNPVTAR